jgi:hypothetical protein
VDLTIEHRDLVEFEASMTIQNWEFIVNNGDWTCLNYEIESATHQSMHVVSGNGVHPRIHHSKWTLW